MFNVNFNLKETKSKKETLIYIRFKIGKKEYKRSTKISIKPIEWDFRKQKAKVLSSRSYKINSILENYAEKIEKIYSDFYNEGKTPKKEDFDNAIKEVSIDVEDIKASKTFFEYFNEYIKTKRVKERTKIKYRTTFNNLKEFQKWRNNPITFDFINDDFFNEFIDFCIDKRENLNSTVKKQISLIKSFLNWAARKEYHSNIKYQLFKFPYNTATTIIYLTKDERLKLFNYDFSYNKRLEQVKDAFMIACFTGLRYSDLEQLDVANIEKDRIVFTSFKTTKRQVIPLNPYVKTIIEKYLKLDDFLKVISNQKFNDYIKECCKIAGIDKPTQKVNLRRREMEQLVSPKYEFITTHTGRRTFGTLYLQDGGRIEILQKIFGHSKITTTMLYLGITAKDIEQDMNNVFPLEENNLKHRNPEKIKTALSLLKNGIELSIISEATGLTFKKLEKLKSQF